MERDYKEIETPIEKKKIKLKTWLTGFEKRKIQNVWFEATKFNLEKGMKNATMDGLSGAILPKAQDVAIEVVVESIDGNKENILETIGNMHEKDFDFVLAEIDKVSKPEPMDGKKKES